MAGSKNHKGAAAKAAEAKRAKEAAAAAAVESDDDEEWVLDTTTPAVLDASVARVPATRKAVAAFQPPPLPELPSATRDKRGVVDETDEKRRERYDKEKALIDRARRVAEGKALTGAKIAAGPYGERRKKTSHWEYVLCEMRWMARDFAAERDWKRESARRVGCAAAASNGKPEPIKRDARGRGGGASPQEKDLRGGGHGGCSVLGESLGARVGAAHPPGGGSGATPASAPA